MSMTVLPRPTWRSRAAAVMSAAAVAVVLALNALALTPTDGAARSNGARPVQQVSADDAAPRVSDRPEGKVDNEERGLRWRGLRDSARCKGAYAVENSRAADGGSFGCSHGPDPAPKGVDVTEKPTVAELQAGVTASETGAVPCYGDGVSGRRIQAIYSGASDRNNRYASVLSLIRTYAARADSVLNTSAARGGQVRHIRWVTNAACQLDVAQVVLTPTGDDSIGNTRAELASLGYNRTDRKYVVWTDDTRYCGIAYTAGDARPDDSNPANNGPTVARVDSGCWGMSSPVEAHEITHTLGGVQLSAPNSNGFCTTVA